MIAKMKNYLRKPHTHWQAYKNLFQITVFRYLVTWFALVPFVAKLFVNIPRNFKVDFLHTSIEYSFNLSLPFNWQLLWYSSLSFVIAYILYIIFCPGFIRKYNSFSDYIAMMHSPRWVIWESKNIFKKKMDIDKFYKRISTKKYTEEIELDKFEAIKKEYNDNKKEHSEEFKSFGVIIEEMQTKLYFMYNNKAYGLGMPVIVNNSVDEEQTKIVEKELFWEVFGRYSASFPKVRFLILTLLGISAVLFSIVLIQNIISGLKYLI
jgi:uncharacterized protein YlbG (UPF0298 family)